MAQIKIDPLKKRRVPYQPQEIGAHRHKLRGCPLLVVELSEELLAARLSRPDQRLKVVGLARLRVARIGLGHLTWIDVVGLGQEGEKVAPLWWVKLGIGIENGLTEIEDRTFAPAGHQCVAQIGNVARRAATEA